MSKAVCNYCGDEETQENPVVLQENPYNAEIEYDHELELLCDRCVSQLTEDI